MPGHEVGAADETAYDTSAQETIRAGQRFTYRDRRSGDRRVGYFDVPTGRFVGLTEPETQILTHFVPPDGQNYARNELLDSDYR